MVELITPEKAKALRDKSFRQGHFLTQLEWAMVQETIGLLTNVVEAAKLLAATVTAEKDISVEPGSPFGKLIDSVAALEKDSR